MYARTSMGRSWSCVRHVGVACVLASFACSYDFGGAGQGGAPGAASSGAGPAETSRSATAAETSAGGDASRAAATASRSSAESSSSTGFSGAAMTPCYRDDFSTFGSNGWTEHEMTMNAVGLSGGEVWVDGGSRASHEVVGTECFVSVTFDMDASAAIDAAINLYVSDPGVGAFGARLEPDGDVLLFEDDLQDVERLGRQKLSNVDALALVFEQGTIFGVARAEGAWVPIATLSRPVWFDAGTDRTGFGVGGAPDATKRVWFRGFSVDTPF